MKATELYTGCTRIGHLWDKLKDEKILRKIEKIEAELEREQIQKVTIPTYLQNEYYSDIEETEADEELENALLDIELKRAKQKLAYADTKLRDKYVRDYFALLSQQQSTSGYYW